MNVIVFIFKAKYRFFLICNVVREFFQRFLTYYSQLHCYGTYPTNYRGNLYFKNEMSCNKRRLKQHLAIRFYLFIIGYLFSTYSLFLFNTLSFFLLISLLELWIVIVLLSKLIRSIITFDTSVQEGQFCYR